MNDFHNALYEANLLYDIKINTELFEEIGLIAWNHIGNKHTTLHRATLKLGEDGIVELPDNLDILEAVTYLFEDWDPSTPVNINGDFEANYNEQFIEVLKQFKDPLYISGQYLKYIDLHDGRIQIVDSRCNYKGIGKIQILYKGVILDSCGLPYLTNRESIAVAAYVAFVTLRKKYYETQNNAFLNLSRLAEEDWKRYCRNARVQEYINQNEMNRILDAKTRWDRKIFNKSYKPIM